jgi:hypothetical protein
VDEIISFSIFRTQIRNHLKYKTKLCEKYTTSGICPYGSRCLFIHPAPPVGVSKSEVPIVTGMSFLPSENTAPSLSIPPPTIEHSLSPTPSMQSIWSSSNFGHLNVQTQQHTPFSKSGPPQLQRLPMRAAVVGSPRHGSVANEIIE